MKSSTPLALTSLLIFLATGCGEYELGLPGIGTDSDQVTISIDPGATSRNELAFGINPLVLDQNTTVTWVNNDTVNHTATSRTGIWDSGELQPGGSFEFQFTQSGAFPYFCRFHESETGLIVIEATSSRPPPPAVPPSPSPSPTEQPGVIPTPGPTPIPIPAPIPTPIPPPLPLRAAMEATILP